MPFYRRSVAVRVRPAGPLTDLRDTCSLAALALLRQLAELCGHSVALLGDIEGHLRALARRAARLHRRSARLQSLLRGRPLPTTNLDLESKKAAPTKLPWQQPVNIFLAAGRPPGMEQLHQEAQLNLQSLLQGGLGEGGGWMLPRLGDYHENKLISHTHPPSQQAAEEETTSSTVLSARPPDTSLSLPTSPDKQPPWPRAFPLPSVEEKQWHQPGSIQTNIVPINVS
ncbi:NHS protein, partial [Chloropsis hardwickii]|nr:NHS protein [Chloropsis hardwickii]